MRYLTPAVDMVVYDRRRCPQLLVKIKMKRQASPEWVRETAQLLWDDEEMPEAPFFLLAMPDQFCLWCNPAHTMRQALAPDYAADPATLLRPFAQGNPFNTGTLDLNAFGLELWTATWLDLLTNPRSSSVLQSDQRPFLEESGLLAAIQGGRLITEERTAA